MVEHRRTVCVDASDCSNYRGSVSRRFPFRILWVALEKGTFPLDIGHSSVGSMVGLFELRFMLNL